MDEESLFDATRAGDVGALRTALAAGFDVDTVDLDGNSALMLAAYHGHAELVALLLEAGADVDRLNADDRSPLAGAVFKGHVEVVNVLVAAGADEWLGMPSAHTMAEMTAREHWLADCGSRLNPHDRGAPRRGR
jgi:ankyrin repeat protein